MYKPEIYIKGQKLDLFKDENISVVSSVQKIEDISRVFNDYSQSFTVPATANNNRIFKHWYNFNINNGFDARVRHTAHIDIQSINFRRGTIRLENCKITNNKPKHYKLTFFGQLIELKSVIGEDYISSLDFSAYDIEYSSDNVKTGLTSGFQSQEMIFPLISTDKQWFYNSSVLDITNQEKLANIAWNGSSDDHGMDWTSFRPALKIMKVIEAIETKYEIQFSRDFLGSEPFDNLYMWFANSESEEALEKITRIKNYTFFRNQQPAIGIFNNPNGSFDVTQNGATKIRNVIFFTQSNDGVAYKIQLMNGNEVLGEVSGTGNLKLDIDTDGGVEPGSSFYGRIVTTAEKTINLAVLEIDELSDDQVGDGTLNVPFTISGSDLSLSDFAPNIKILDFLKSIIRMYNLTVVPSSETSFDIYTLDDWYAEGDTYDISKYVDTEEITVNRSKIFSEITFSFSEPKTILAEQFEQVNLTAYGDLETELKNSEGTPLDGEEFEVELAFEQMIYEKLNNVFNDEETNIVYGLSLDKGLDSVFPEAHLFYSQPRSVTSNRLSFVGDDGTKSLISASVFMPSHASGDNQKHSTCFGGEVNEHTGAFNNNSLFARYYRDYITDSFSIKRRKFDLKTRLPLWLLNILKLNDKLIIGTDRYIINEMTVNASNQVTEFELLNDIYGESDVFVEQLLETNQTPEEPQPVNGRSFTMSQSGSSTSLGGCGLSANAVRYWNGTEANPTLGDIVYTNLNMSIKFNGGSLYYKIGNDKAIRVNSNGVVMDVYFCSQGGGGGNQ